MRKWSIVSVMALVLLPLGVSGGRGGAEEAEGDGPSLTVYSGNIALVRRDVPRVLSSGTQTVRIDGLPTNLDPSSLVVLNGEITLLGAHGFRSYQDVASGPGASIDLDLDVASRVETLQLAFLTAGLSWSANYSMVVARDDQSARVEGYATVSNNSGAAYSDAEFQLLAGTIRQGGGARYEADAIGGLRAFESAAQAPQMQQAAFGDYHVYTLSTPISLRSGESRRIRLMGAATAKTEKLYTLSQAVNYHRQSPEPVTSPVVVSYRVERPEGSELGEVPLPGGQVRIMQRDDEGRIQLLGIATISNTPKAEDLRLSTGYAFDIVATRTQTDYERPAGNVYESAWRVELRNRSDEDVRVRVIEQLSGDWSIVESSHRSEKISAGAALFLLDVPAGGATTLEYRVSVKS